MKTDRETQAPALACNLGALTPPERSRRSELAAAIRREALGIAEAGSGYSVALPDDPVLCARVLELILLERRCCPFLSFELRFEPGAGSVRLGLGGPPGAREFLRENGLLGSVAAGPEAGCC